MLHWNGSKLYSTKAGEEGIYYCQIADGEQEKIMTGTLSDTGNDWRKKQRAGVVKRKRCGSETSR